MRTFVRLAVRVGVDDAERVLAEAWSAGCCGAEEREADESEVTLILYAPAGRGPAVQRAARAALGPRAPGVGLLEPAPKQDWAQDWKRGLGPVVVSSRLVVRPPFVPSPLPGARQVLVDPGQAFGTGSHASTRLALELVDTAMGLPRAPVRVLDVGTGSGVLALAALALGAGGAVGLDTDRVALREAHRNARRSRLRERLHLVAGAPNALGRCRFDLVLANLLASELRPWLPDLAARLEPGGFAVLSGLLEGDAPAFRRMLGALGLEERATRAEADERGDRWRAWLMQRPDRRASDRRGSPETRTGRCGATNP